MNKQNAKRKEWVVTKDDVGRAVLQWQVDPECTAEERTDPLAQTYNFLRRLDLPDLGLEGEIDEDDHNPYNSGVYSTKQIQSK